MSRFGRRTLLLFIALLVFLLYRYTIRLRRKSASSGGKRQHHFPPKLEDRPQTGLPSPDLNSRSWGNWNVSGNVSTRLKPKRPELFYMLHTELMNLKIRLKGEGIDTAKDNELQSRISLLINLYQNVTNLREEEYGELVDRITEKIQDSMNRLQNPGNCSTAKKLVCVLDNWYGFGGMVHHAVYCYHMGLASKRIVFFHFLKGNYYREVLRPTTFCKLGKVDLDNLPVWNGVKDSPVLDRPIVAFHMRHKIKETFDCFPTDSLPRDVAPHIQEFHGLPVAWWQGQLVKFIMKPVDGLMDRVEAIKDEIGFELPILGMHVRRTDKHVRYTHNDFEYMKVASAWFDVYDQRLMVNRKPPLKKRRIFLATENTSTVEEFRRKYTKYEFVNNMKATKLSEDKGKRLHKEALLGLMVDIHLLSRCTHLICDGNSNVCRLAYELMQTRRVDASARFTPVGLVYHNFPARNRFEYVLDYSTPRGQWFERQMHRLDWFTTSLDPKYQIVRVTDAAPVDVL